MDGNEIQGAPGLSTPASRLVPEPAAPVAAPRNVAQSSPEATAPIHRRRTARPKSRPVPLLERVLERLIHILAYTAVAAMILIFVFVAKEALPLLTSPEIHEEVTLAKMWFIQHWPGYDAPEHVWQPVSEIPKYGVWPLLVGTLKVTIIAMLVAVPLSVAAAVFVSQYAGQRTREIVKPAIEFLAGIPSVVLGFFALIVMASWFQEVFGFDSRLNAVVAGVALSFAVIPIVFTVCEEALGAVPPSYVEASVALGAARWQTITKVVLPAAAPGIAASVALGLGRAFGETMIVLMASGNAAILSANPAESVRTLSATIAAELAEVVFGGPHYTVLFALAVLLFLITFGINFAGDYTIMRMKRRMGVAA
ncbi:MAG: phosphate ABC transporter permease subunit PstC [Deltaproteobacteria bacterium]|nr:phosphate ABC transporter permease subunit PstC [Deltaproteobacteria bacterium]